ncbi:MAG: hypothetical protein EA400_13960 [Chromatiaceae bacterium]|nr:MAG: hypothetical protein EA400_13960 [Chromatiaceae bacterium]
MKAIELEATVEQHAIRLPDSIPNGTQLRVLLLLEDSAVPSSQTADLKRLLAGLTEGLTLEDLERQQDDGRGDPEWAS